MPNVGRSGHIKIGQVETVQTVAKLAGCTILTILSISKLVRLKPDKPDLLLRPCRMSIKSNGKDLRTLKFSICMYIPFNCRFD